MSTIAFDSSPSRTTVLPARHLVAVPDLPVTPALRLTRRGKAFILTVAVAIIAVLVVLFGSSSLAGDKVGAAARDHHGHGPAGPHALGDRCRRQPQRRHPFDG